MAADETPATTASVEVPARPAKAPEPSADWAQALGALIAVLLLFMLLATLAKRLQERGTLAQWLTGTRRDAKHPDAQLAIEQSIMLDPKTRLVMVRRGDVAHLLCLHAQGATVVESNISLNPITPKEPVA
jgi:flagellar biogenesis protein FliO